MVNFCKWCVVGFCAIKIGVFMRLQVGLGMKLYLVLFASVVLSSSHLFGAGQNQTQNDSRLAVRPFTDKSRDGSDEAAVKYPLFTQPSTPTFNGYQQPKSQLDSDSEDSDYEDKSDGEERKVPVTRQLGSTYVQSDTLPQAQLWSFVVRNKDSGKYEEDKIAIEEKELLDDMIAWRYLSTDQQNRSQWHTSPPHLNLRLASIFKKGSEFRYQTKDGGFVYFKNDYLWIGHPIKGSFTINLAVVAGIGSRQSSVVGQGGGGLDEKDGLSFGGEERAEAEQGPTPQRRWTRYGSSFLGLGAVAGALSYLVPIFFRGSGDSPVGGNSPAETNSQVDSEANAAPVLVEEQAQAQVSTQDEVADIAPAIQISEVASNKEVSDSGLDEDLQQVQEALGEVGGDLYSSNNSEAVEKALTQEEFFAARFVSDGTLSMAKKTALGSLLTAGVLKLFHYCYSQYKKNSGLRGAKGKAQMWAKKALYYAQQYKKMTMATAGGLAVVGFYLLQNR